MFQLYIKDLAFLGSVCSAGHLSVLVRRVRDMVAEGQDPESAQQMIVEERVCWDPDRRGPSRFMNHLPINRVAGYASGLPCLFGVCLKLTNLPCFLENIVDVCIQLFMIFFTCFS